MNRDLKINRAAHCSQTRDAFSESLQAAPVNADREPGRDASEIFFESERVHTCFLSLVPSLLVYPADCP